MQLTQYRVTRVPGNGVTSDDLTTLIKKNFAPIQSGTPSGSIIAYLGQDDVPGWVLCDGNPRANTNAMYDKVVSLGVGVFDNGFYIPLDLRDKFLAGRLISKSEFNTDSFDGSNTATLGVGNLPSHTHTGTTNSTDTDHTHKSFSRELSVNINQGDGNGNGKGADRNVTTTTEVKTSEMKNSLTGLDANNNATHSHSFTTDSTGSGTSFSIVPLHYRVNYLLKL